MIRYKTAEGKKENKFGCGGKPQGAAFARKVVDACLRQHSPSTSKCPPESKLKDIHI